MNENEVFVRMKFYHEATGRVMWGATFIREITLKFSKDEAIEGLLLFNDYLDQQRKDAS